MTDPLPSPAELEEQARRQREQNERQRIANEIVDRIEAIGGALAEAALRALVMAAFGQSGPMALELARSAAAAHARITTR